MLLCFELDNGGIETELGGVKSLLADQSVRNQLFCATHVSPRVLELNFLAPDRYLGLAEGGAGLVSGRFIEVALNLQQQLTGLDILAFDYRQADDLSDHLGRDLDLFLGRDLTGRFDASGNGTKLGRLDLDFSF
jgi:hypothetical protein